MNARMQSYEGRFTKQEVVSTVESGEQGLLKGSVQTVGYPTSWNHHKSQSE